MSKLFWSKEKIDILITYLRNGVPKSKIIKKFGTTMDALNSAIKRYDLKKHIIQLSFQI